MKRITILLLTIVLYGCNQSLHHGESSQTRPSQTISYVLSDRRHPEFEYVYYFQGSSVVAQKHVFPGYADRQIYLCEALPQSIHKDLMRMVSHEGEITPPIEPGGVWYTITSFDHGRRASTAYFKNTNHDVACLFSDLRNRCMTKPNEIERLPEYVLSHFEIVPFFGESK